MNLLELLQAILAEEKSEEFLSKKGVLKNYYLKEREFRYKIILMIAYIIV
jgi:hypothetical protein